MLISILSPAKSLDLKSIEYPECSIPHFLSESSKLAKIMKSYSVGDIADLMGISRNLSELNYERFQVWQKEHTQSNSKPCIYTFNGDVYEGLQALSLNPSDIEFANSTLRILSGMYGVLKPLDLIQAYRLEMGIKLKTPSGKNLYDFWQKKVSDYFVKMIKEKKATHFINLASDEYSKSIDFGKFKIPVITPTFKEEKEGKLQFVSFYAKRARGLMTRYILQNKITDPESLKGFDLEGYHFNESGSKGNLLLFTR